MRVVDLFCGAGGFSCGAQQAGCTVVAGVDNERVCIPTFESNIGSPCLQLDLHDATSQDTVVNLCQRENVHVILGSPPCQPYSIANVHKGRVGSGDFRKSLPGVFARIVSRASPKAFILEEVRPFATSVQLREVLDVLEGQYCCQVQILDARDFGVAQRRKRCIVVGVRKDLDVRAALHPSQTCATHLTVAEAFARDQPAPGAILAGRTLEKCIQRRELELAGEQPPSWQTIHRRISWDAPAPTLTCSANRPGSWRCLFRKSPGEDKGGTYHRLSLEEAACLMGFPPGYVFTGPVNARFSQVGNAVPPPLSRALLLHLRLLLSLPPLTGPP